MGLFVNVEKRLAEFKGDLIFEVNELIQKQKDEHFKEVTDWKAKYEALNADYQVLKTQKLQDENISKSTNTISIVALQNYIEKEIIDTNENSKWIPDGIERKAYLSVYKTLIESLKNISDTSEIVLFNHRLTFHLEPV